MARTPDAQTETDTTGTSQATAERPPELSNLEYTPENYRRIAIVHMLHGLDMLRAVALDPANPIKIRKEAMAVLVEAGANALAKAGRSGRETDPAESGLLQRLAEALASSDPDILDAALRTAPGSLPPPVEPVPAAADHWPTEVLEQLPTPEEAPVSVEAEPRRTIECKPQTTPDRILFFLRREGPLHRKRLRDFLRETGFVAPDDWKQSLQDLMTRGLIYRASMNGKGPALYRLTGLSAAPEEG